MTRLWMNILWFTFWKWRKPRSGFEMRRKLIVYCGRRPKYSKDQLLIRSVTHRADHFGQVHS